MPIRLFASRNGARWRLPIVVILICGAALALELLAHRWAKAEMRQESIRQKTIERLLVETVNAKAPACAPEFSYAHSLPESISLDKLVQSLHDSAKAFGVTVLSVSGEPHPATPRTLPSLDANIVLHGAYPALKSTLAESLSRFQTGAIRRMHFKRESAAMPTTEEANVEVAFALRPQSEVQADCRMTSGDGGAFDSK